MSEAPIRRPPASFRKVLLTVFAIGLVAAVSLLIYLRSNSFRSLVHRRLVAALEQMTGGRVELGRFTVVPFEFRVEAHDLVIHGREAPTEAPYAYISKLVASIKIISIFEREYGFSSLSIDRPVFHIIVYSDGTTNQPKPKKVQGVSQKTGVEELFALSITRLEVTRGELLWNDQAVPLDFRAGGVSAGLDYALLRGRYDGYLKLGKLDTKLSDFRPFSSTVNLGFALAKNSIEVKSLAWSSSRSRIEASGAIADLRNPSFRGGYNLRLNLADLASTARIPQLQAGTLEASGTGSFSAADFSTTGKLLVKELAWQDSSTTVQNVSFLTHYNLTPKALKFPEFEARLLGGEASGSMDVANWLSHPRAGKQGAAEQRGVLSLRFKNLSASALASAFTAVRRRLSPLKISGSGEGYLEAKWKRRAANAEAAFTANFTPGSETRAGEIPLSARLIGVYRGASEELELSQLNVATRATVIRASGRLSSHASLRMSVSTTDLNEWQPILNSLQGPQIPILLKGRATFHGSATGKLSDPTIAGRLEMEDFDTRLMGSFQAAQRRVHWDSFVANVELSRRAVSVRNALMTHDDARLAFDVSGVLEGGQFKPNSPFVMRVQLRGGDLSDVGSLFGYRYPLGGRVNLTLTLSGEPLNPHGDGHVEIEHGSFNGELVPRFASDLRFINGEIQFNNLKLALRDSEVTGDGAYNSRTRAFRFNIGGRDFNVSRFAAIERPPIRITGRMDFNAHGGGTVDAPVINADVDLRDLSFDHEQAGDFHFQAATHGAELELQGRSHFPQAELSVDGTVHLRQDWPADLKLHFDRLDVDPLLLAYLGNRVTGHSSVSGDLELHGPLREANELTANGNFTSVSFNVENIALANQGPIRFSLARQALTLDQLRLVGEGTDMAARGTVQLAGNRGLDLRAEGRMNLKMIENLSPDLNSSGQMAVAVKVGGTYQDPSLLGNVEISNAAISSNNLPNGLSEMNGTLVFNQNRLEIQSLSGRIGGGSVKLTGFMAYSPSLEFNVTAHGQDVRLRPAGISAVASADLQLAGTRQEATLSGDVTVVKLNLSPQFDFARYLEASKQSPALPQTNTILSNVRLDVHVVTTPELQMQSSLAKLSGDADLQLRGTLVRPVVLGRIDITEGNIYFSGTKYRLERGEVTFLGPTGVKPTLDLEAATRVRDYDITLGVNGTPDKLNFTYRSEPPLPSADIVALLALGRTQNESATLASSSTSGFSQEASNLILSQALNATLSNRAQRLFGISRIKIDPQGLNTETTPTRTAPAVTIEQQVSNQFTLTYTTEVSQTSQQIIQAEYNLTHNISILAVRDRNGVLSFDLRLRQRRK